MINIKAGVIEGVLPHVYFQIDKIDPELLKGGDAK